LVNERYEEKRSMLITSNFNGVELEEQIGPRIVSRLTEMTEPLPLLGEDNRKENWQAA